MNGSAHGLKPGLVLATMGLAAMLAIHSLSTAQSPVAVNTSLPTFEYRTQQVDINLLQPTLVTLGGEGWDVVTILHIDQFIQNAADGQAHLMASRVEIVCRRPLPPTAGK